MTTPAGIRSTPSGRHSAPSSRHHLNILDRRHRKNNLSKELLVRIINDIEEQEGVKTEYLERDQPENGLVDIHIDRYEE